MMTQLTAVVAQEPADEVSAASRELAQYLEQQSSAIAPPEEDIAGSAEALLPVKEVSRAPTPSDRPLSSASCDRKFPETPNPPSFRIDDSADSAKKTSSEAMPTNDGAGGIAPQIPWPTQDLLQSIRIGWRDLVGETAGKIQRLSQATVEQALEMGQQLQRMQRDLKRKEYSTFLSVLGWASAKARKFINLAKTFSEFEPSALINVELTTLLSLCSKKYQAVVAQLREANDITQQLVEQLIKEHRAPRKTKQEQISGWKQTRSGGGRYYNVLLHSEEAGLSIELMAESEAILPQRVIEEAVALRAQQKSSDLVQVSRYYAAQMEELPIVVENARELDRENRQLTLELSKRARVIAELEAQLASRVVVPSVEPDGVQMDEVTVVPSNLEASLESLPLGSAPEKITEIEPMALTSECSEPIEKSEHLEPELPGDLWSEKQESALVLSPGNLVQINVTRPNGDKTWNGGKGYIQKLSPATGKAVVLLQGDYRSKHFFLDELKLVHSVEGNLSDTLQTYAPESVEETRATAILQDAVASESIESLTTLTTPQDAVASEQVQPASQLEASDDASAADCKSTTPLWEQLNQLRDAEGDIREIEAKIKGVNDRIVERELRNLLCTKISQLVNRAKGKGIPADYEVLRTQGRIVLESEYAAGLIRQAQTWTEVAMVVGCDRSQLINAVKKWQLEQRQILVPLLSAYLETEPSALEHIDWIPKSLLEKSLSTLSFKIRKIGGASNLVEHPKIEYIPCNFVSLEYPGTKREQWIFRGSDNKLYPVFGRDEIEVERF